jgi:ribosomal protein S27AE
MKTTDETIDVEPIQYSIVDCPNCGQKNRISNEPNCRFRCGKCKHNINPLTPLSRVRNFIARPFIGPRWNPRKAIPIAALLIGCFLFFITQSTRRHSPEAPAKGSLPSIESPGQYVQQASPSTTDFDSSKSDPKTLFGSPAITAQPRLLPKTHKPPAIDQEGMSLPYVVKQDEVPRPTVVSSDKKQPALARTIAPTNLREEPDQSSRILRRLKAGEGIYLVDKHTNINGFTEVVHTASDTTGWLSLSTISTKKKNLDLNTTSPFVGEFVGKNTPPEVIVKNLSTYQITLVVAGNLNHIPANGSLSINPSPGSQPYRASAPGVIPSAGYQNFESGYRYTWSFWVVTQRY